MTLSKDDILNISDIQVKEIDVSEWGGTVYIKQLSRGQADEYTFRRFGKSEMKKGDIETDVTLFGHDTWLVAQGVCDADGKRIFSNSDIKKLEEKNANAIGSIAVEIVKFSGMQEDVEELDELKN